MYWLDLLNDEDPLEIELGACEFKIVPSPHQLPDKIGGPTTIVVGREREPYGLIRREYGTGDMGLFHAESFQARTRQSDAPQNERHFTDLEAALTGEFSSSPNAERVWIARYATCSSNFRHNADGPVTPIQLSLQFPDLTIHSSTSQAATGVKLYFISPFHIPPPILIKKPSLPPLEISHTHELRQWQLPHSSIVQHPSNVTTIEALGVDRTPLKKASILLQTSICVALSRRLRFRAASMTRNAESIAMLQADHPSICKTKILGPVPVGLENSEWKLFDQFAHRIACDDAKAIGVLEAYSAILAVSELPIDHQILTIAAQFEGLANRMSSALAFKKDKLRPLSKPDYKKAKKAVMIGGLSPDGENRVLKSIEYLRKQSQTAKIQALVDEGLVEQESLGSWVKARHPLAHGAVTFIKDSARHRAYLMNGVNSLAMHLIGYEGHLAVYNAQGLLFHARSVSRQS